MRVTDNDFNKAKLAAADNQISKFNVTNVREEIPFKWSPTLTTKGINWQ